MWEPGEHETRQPSSRLESQRLRVNSALDGHKHHGRMKGLRILVRISAAIVGTYLLALVAWFIPGVPGAFGGRVAVALVGIGYVSAVAGLASLALTAIVAVVVCCHRVLRRTAI